MKTYAIAWTEFYNDTIRVEFYKAKTSFGAAKACWKAHMMDGVQDEATLEELRDVLDNFETVGDIVSDFYDCEENISEPIPIENC